MKRGEIGVCSDCGEEQIIYQAKRGVCRKCYQRSRGRTEGCPRCGDYATGAYWLQDVCRGCRHEIHMMGVSAARNEHGGDRYIPGPHVVHPVPYLGELLSPEERIGLLSPETRERYIKHIKSKRGSRGQ